MEISKEKSETMVNSVNIDNNANILMDGTKLEDVKTFKYIGSTLKYDGSSENELSIRLVKSTSAMVRLDTIWRSKNIRFTIKFNLYKSLILSILLYGCETWTLKEKEDKKIKSFESKAHRRLLGITYRQRKINIYVQ